jgi:cytochrome d ubiquinol oxidase subunit II
MSLLQITWFILIGVLFTVYLILDGFDLGVGILYLFTKQDKDRRALLSMIGPYWNGNEVWLLAAGGAMFAAFPPVYATVFSSFYIPIMLALFAIIFRAIAIDFRNKSTSRSWQWVWDIAFTKASILIPLLLGIALGNVLHGIKLDSSLNYAGTLSDIFNPFAMLVGLLGIAMCATHGAAFIVMKTEGELQDRAASWLFKATSIYLFIFILFSITTFFTQLQLYHNFINNPVLFALPIATLLSILAIISLNMRGSDTMAFVASSLSIMGVLTTIGVSLFPNFVFVINDADLNLTIMNSSSSPHALNILLIVAILGIPLIIAYQVWTRRQLTK